MSPNSSRIGRRLKSSDDPQRLAALVDVDLDVVVPQQRGELVAVLLGERHLVGRPVVEVAGDGVGAVLDGRRVDVAVDDRLLELVEGELLDVRTGPEGQVGARRRARRRHRRGEDPGAQAGWGSASHGSRGYR